MMTPNQYYYRGPDGGLAGPYSYDELKEFTFSGAFPEDFEVTLGQGHPWQRFSELGMAEQQAPIQQPQFQQPNVQSQHSYQVTGLRVAGTDKVNAKDHAAKGTGFHAAIGWAVAVVVFPLIFIVLILVSYGIALIAGLIYLATYYYRRRHARALIRGSTLHVSPHQFPEIYQTVESMSKRLGLAKVPETYIVEGNHFNAFALRAGSDHYVILLDDIVYGCMMSGEPRALSFIIGHELAHHALGHTGLIRRAISSKYPPLGRLDEFSCDAVANALVGDSAVSRQAFATLLVGPQLVQQVNLAALDEQARAVEQDKFSRKVESKQTHPLLLRRYYRLLQK